MLNRTNRTLLAISNRLNLGKRSPDLCMAGVNGTSSLRVHSPCGYAPRVGTTSLDEPMTSPVTTIAFLSPAVLHFTPSGERWPTATSPSTSYDRPCNFAPTAPARPTTARRAGARLVGPLPIGPQGQPGHRADPTTGSKLGRVGIGRGADVRAARRSLAATAAATG